MSSTRWTQDDVNKLPQHMVVQGGNRKLPFPQKQQGGYKALGRQKAGTMNNTEKKYAARLELMKVNGEVLWYSFGPANLRLGDKCFYKVDFLVMQATGHLEVHEVKGFWTDDALVKIKVAAEKFPFRFIAVSYKKGEWTEREF